MAKTIYYDTPLTQYEMHVALSFSRPCWIAFYIWEGTKRQEQQ
jgi:hypothetical protein